MVTEVTEVMEVTEVTEVMEAITEVMDAIEEVVIMEDTLALEVLVVGIRTPGSIPIITM